MTETLRVRSDGIAWQTVEDELVILDEERSVYLRLAGAAVDLWPLITEGTTLDAMAQALVATFGIDHDRALRDCAVLVDELRAHDLLSTLT